MHQIRSHKMVVRIYIRTCRDTDALFSQLCTSKDRQGVGHLKRKWIPNTTTKTKTLFSRKKEKQISRTNNIESQPFISLPDISSKNKKNPSSWNLFSQYLLQKSKKNSHVIIFQESPTNGLTQKTLLYFVSFLGHSCNSHAHSTNWICIWKH